LIFGFLDIEMSDFGSELDDEILALAGAGDKKRKKKQATSGSAKRRKAS
jgi:hypothetical protein